MRGTEELLTLVAEGAEYALLGSADGSRFVLRYNVDGLSADIQGDDAARFKADYETTQLQFPTWSADQVLAQLWDQGGYSWLAIEEGR